MPPKQAKKKNNKRRPAPLTRPPVAGEVLVRMRLGFVTTQVLTGSAALDIRVNDPIAYVPGWIQRAGDYLSYRVVRVQVYLQPKDSVNPGSGQLYNISATYSTVMTESVNAPPTIPPSAAAILELPGARLLPYSQNNPRSLTRFTWTCSDLNGLIYGPVGSPPPASYVNVFAQIGNAPQGTARLDFNGWMDIEFRGIAVL